MLMKNLNIKLFVWLLLGVSSLTWYGILASSNVNQLDAATFFGPLPKVALADVVLITLFLKWGWKIKWLQGWLVPFPDLSGTWLGSLQTDWVDEEGNTPGPIPTMLTIKQSFGQMSCKMWTGEMRSYSVDEAFRINSERQVRELSYSYTSNPDTKLRNRSTPHDGTARLSIIGHPPERLEGEYWTQRSTKGTIKLSLHTRLLLDELPANFGSHPMA